MPAKNPISKAQKIDDEKNCHHPRSAVLARPCHYSPLPFTYIQLMQKSYNIYTHVYIYIDIFKNIQYHDIICRQNICWEKTWYVANTDTIGMPWVGLWIGASWKGEQRRNNEFLARRHLAQKILYQQQTNTEGQKRCPLGPRHKRIYVWSVSSLRKLHGWKRISLVHWPQASDDLTVNW